MDVLKKVLKIVSITIAIAGAIAAAYFFVIKVIEKLKENCECDCCDEEPFLYVDNSQETEVEVSDEDNYPKQEDGAVAETYLAEE